MQLSISSVQHLSLNIHPGAIAASSQLRELTASIESVIDQPRHTKLDELGGELPLSAKEWSFLIDNKAGLIFDLRGAHEGNHESCIRYASNSNALARKWRLGTVEELFLHIADRTQQKPAINPELVPAKFGNRWIWSSTPDAKPEDPASPVYAWGVDLHDGGADVDGRRLVGLALPVSELAVSPGQS